MCDGLSAINRVGIEHKYIKSSSKHADMLAIFSELREKSKFYFVKEQALDHPDELNRSLNIFETLNCRMECLAKDIAREEIMCAR